MTKFIHASIDKSSNKARILFIATGGKQITAICSYDEAERLYRYIGKIPTWHTQPSLAPAGLWNAARNAR